MKSLEFEKKTSGLTTGTVKFFNQSKGFGFITQENSAKEIFVHVSGLVDEIKEGDVVKYQLDVGKKGVSAKNVQKD
ncbi:MAG: cold shock domain-containing protein [Algibacter sp.]